MRAVVDTNVIAYFLLGTEPFLDEAKAFWAAVTEPTAPASWEAEVANVLWMATRTNVLGPGEAALKLEYALTLGIQSVPVTGLWQGALMRSVASAVAVYDTLFVELADRRGVRMATFDDRVLKAFPGIARRPGELLPPIR